MEQNYRMIDVGDKDVTRRKAIARGSIRLSAKTMEMIRQGDSPKGNILAIAEVAGIMAAKNTASLLPLCHPLLLDSIRIRFELDQTEVHVFCEVICSAKTGVEMEALVGVNVCLLTIYDLAKAVDPLIEISGIHLLRKEGGKSGVWLHPNEAHDTKMPRSKSLSELRIAVGTLSDRASRGVYEDESGEILREFIRNGSGTESFYLVVPDEESEIKSLVAKAVETGSDVLLLTGGTGIGRRDITPDVLKGLSSKELVGFGELQRYHGAKHTEYAWLSRASAYVVSKTLVVLFPGNPRAVQQGVECLGELIPHAVKMIHGKPHHRESEATQ
jgi:molybdenum cofactor biosynthesis protein MoaC